MKGKLALGALAAALGTHQCAFAVDAVTVVGDVTTTTLVVPQLVTANASLVAVNASLREIAFTANMIGTAIVQSGDKVTSAITESARVQREADIFGRQTEALEDARKSFTVPDSICSESASGVAAAVGKVSRAGASKLAGGGGVSNQVVQKALDSLPVAPQQGAYRSAAMHAAYCTDDESKRYGGTDLCPSASSLPGGDTEMRSLLDGAGAVGKAPDLTFTQAQVDAAMAYMKNSARHDAGRAPGKGEIQSATGREYQGLMTQYQAIQSAATQPQLDIIAASQANPASRDALREALQSPSAAEFFAATASPEAQRTMQVSEREFEAFEVGRRYANTAYEADLQQMEGDNLVRELVRVQSLSNWLQLGAKNELRQANIIAGQQLALAADDTYRPRFQELSQKMAAGVSANGN